MTHGWSDAWLGFFVATSYSPRRYRPPVSPTGRGGRYPNQVHSLTSLKTTWERNVADEMKKNPPHKG